MVKTISPELLRQALAGDDPPVVLDTRAADAFDSWHIPGAVNFPYKPENAFNPNGFTEQTGIDQSDPIVTICGKGKSSYAIGTKLIEAGWTDVTVVQDGMEGWSRLYEVASVPTIATALEIFQIQRVAKGCLGYVIGSPVSGEAFVIDPTRHIEEFEFIAADDDMTITGVIDTHLHADHISGGRALADDRDATYYLPAATAERDISTEFEPLERNEVISLGDIDLKFIETPGHTSDSMSILVGGEAVLTGDTLFLDSVGRTELQFGEADAEEGARQLFESIHGSLLSLPDGFTVLPGHFSPEKVDAITAVGSPLRTTIGSLRTDAPLLQLDRSTFVERLQSKLPEKPPNYERMIAINAGNDTPENQEEAIELELGPNRCAISTD